MDDQEGKKASFVVKDNRRFDNDGNERSDIQKQSKSVERASASAPKDSLTEGMTAPKPPASRPPPVPEVVASDSPSAKEYDEQAAGQPSDEIDFSSFVISLGTQALMQLGVIKAPEGMAMPVDKQAAKQTIDILSMLERKTKGNLDPTEAKLLEEVLHNCRIGFIRAG